MAIRVPGVHRAVGCSPDRLGELAVIAFEAFRNPGRRLGPVDRLLRGPSQVADGRPQASDLFARPPRPHSKEVAQLRVDGEQGHPNTLVSCIVAVGMRRRVLVDRGEHFVLVLVAKTEHPRLDADEGALLALPLDVDGDHRVQRRIRGCRRTLREASVEHGLRKLLVVQRAALGQNTDGRLSKGHLPGHVSPPPPSSSRRRAGSPAAGTSP